MSEFIINKPTVTPLSDHELYLKSVAFRVMTESNREPNRFEQRTLEILYDEANSRANGERLWSAVCNDAELRIAARMYSRREPMINRIDFMNKQELYECLAQFGGWKANNRNDFTRNFHAPAGMTYVDVVGDSMEPGISSGETIIADTTAKPHDGAVVIAVVRQSKIIKRIEFVHDGILLKSDNERYPALFAEHGTVDILGVARYRVAVIK